MANTMKFAALAFSASALIAGGMLVAATQAPGATRSRPKNLDLSLERVTDHGVFRIKLNSTLLPIQISKVHQWSARVSGADGKPVAGAVISVDGGMPEHGHGLPTAPRATSAGEPGNYVIDGMKFSMTGWWVLNLEVMAPDGRTDNITFNVIL